MTYRDSCSDTARTTEVPTNQKRLSDPDVIEVDTRPWTIADEKRANPDSIGTASDYADTTRAYRDNDPRGFQPQYANSDNDDDRGSGY